MEVKIESQGEQFQITVDAGDGSGPETLTADSEIDAISDAWQYLVDRGVDDSDAEEACRQALGLG